MRVRAHHFQLRDNEYVPFIETDAADAYREVALVAQPGSQEAFLAAPEREVLLAGPRGTGKTLSLLMDFFADVGAEWGAELERHPDPAIDDRFSGDQVALCEGDPADMAECALQPEPKSVDLADRRDAQIGLLR